MLRTQIALTLTASLLAFTPLAARAQGANSQDKTFVKDAIETNLAEIELGQLALSKSSNAQVRQFAQKMIDDHSKLNDKLKGIAPQIGVSIPSSPSVKDHAVKVKLDAESGATFDKGYINAMVSGHRAADADFKKEEANGQDPQVKSAATEAEPTVAEHLRMAEDIQSKL